MVNKLEYILELDADGNVRFGELHKLREFVLSELGLENAGTKSDSSISLKHKLLAHGTTIRLPHSSNWNITRNSVSIKNKNENGNENESKNRDEIMFIQDPQLSTFTKSHILGVIAQGLKNIGYTIKNFD